MGTIKGNTATQHKPNEDKQMKIVDTNNWHTTELVFVWDDEVNVQEYKGCCGFWELQARSSTGDFLFTLDNYLTKEDAQYLAQGYLDSNRCSCIVTPNEE